MRGERPRQRTADKRHEIPPSHVDRHNQVPPPGTSLIRPWITGALFQDDFAGVPELVTSVTRAWPVGWAERSDTHHVVLSPCWCTRMTDYRRNFIAGCGFFFERLFSKVMGFARAQPILL